MAKRDYAPFQSVYDALSNDAAGGGKLYPRLWIDDALKQGRGQGFFLPAPLLIARVSELCGARNRRVVEAFESRFLVSEKARRERERRERLERCFQRARESAAKDVLFCQQVRERRIALCERWQQGSHSDPKYGKSGQAAPEPTAEPRRGLVLAVYERKENVA